MNKTVLVDVYEIVYNEGGVVKRQKYTQRDLYEAHKKHLNDKKVEILETFEPREGMKVLSE